MDLSNFVFATSNREVLKYIFNVLDSSIAELEVEISARNKESKNILNKYTSVSEFLRETDYDSRVSLDDAIEDIDKTLELLQVELVKLNSTMVSSSKNIKILSYLDFFYSDYTGSIDGMKSTSKQCFSFCSNVFSWCSKKQEIMACKLWKLNS